VRIGDRLRAARQFQNLTIDEVATASGLTKGFISRVERDQTSPSVATLVALCQVLSISVGSLFEEPKTDHVRAEDAPTVDLGGIATEERLLTPRGQSLLQLIKSEIAPGGNGGDALYTVNCEIEVVHVIKGSITITLPEKTIRLGTGDSLTFPGRVPHLWKNSSNHSPATVIWIISPAPWRNS
jgi:transcriptional regulator with XRE-family HTH domain